VNDDETLLDDKDCRKDLRDLSPLFIASGPICHLILPPVFVSWANIPSIEISNSIVVSKGYSGGEGEEQVLGELREKRLFGQFENDLILEWWC
jgi:hypothetical protein